MLKRVLPLATIAAVMAIAGISPAVQAQDEPSTFSDAVIRPKFAPDPMELKGFTGGKRTAKQVAGTAETQTGACLGFMSKQPYHRLELKKRFRYLSIIATSTTDTTMVIKGPGGTWCNDDYDEKNAGITGEWLPGNYDVWVGSYSKVKAVPYVLKISETR